MTDRKLQGRGRMPMGGVGREGVALAIACLAFGHEALAASTVTGLEFRNGAASSQLVITADGPVALQKQEDPQGRQIILDLKGAKLSKAALRRIDTASFNSKVTLISPYQLDGSGDAARIVLQLREPVAASVSRNGNVFQVIVPNSNVAAKAKAAAPAPAKPAVAAKPAAPAAKPAVVPAFATAAKPVSATAPGAPSRPAVVPKPAQPAAIERSLPLSAAAPVTPDPSVDAPAAPPPAPFESDAPPADAAAAAAATASDASMDGTDRLGQALEARETGHFVGKPITLQVRDADVNDVLRLISDASGFNIVVGDDVRGKVTLSLVDVPWDQALDVVLRTLKLGAERNNNLLRVVTLAELTREKQQENLAKQAALASSPTVTKIFPVSYAKPEDLVTVLKQFGTAAPAAVVSGGPQQQAQIQSLFKIEVDRRTNSLVVQDTPDNIEKIKRLIQLLDTQTPQVLIEAKVIEAGEDFNKSLNGSLGIGNASGTQYFASFAGGNPLDSLFGSAGVFANGTAAAAKSVTSTGINGAAFGLAPELSFIPGSPRLNALLNLLEGESSIKVISSPKMVVLNKERATVTQATPIAIPVDTVSNGVVEHGYKIEQAEVTLNVTPSVTNDGSVQLDLNLTRGIPVQTSAGIQAVGNRNLNTKVLVDSGSTLVIGGVYTMQVNKASSGFPLLRKIPIIGALFGSETESTSRNELFFFITPKILNVREAGMGT